MSYIKPFLKWPGGKYKLLDTIFSFFPKDGKRLIEPFLGAGSVSINSPYKETIASDINADLINVWDTLQEYKEEFISKCENVFKFNNDDPKDAEHIYYQCRNTFNSSRLPEIFIYLNKHCFNGVIRYNKKGEFNVPYGKRKNSFPRDEMEAVLKIIPSIEFFNVSFENIMCHAEKMTWFIAILLTFPSQLLPILSNTQWKDLVWNIKNF